MEGGIASFSRTDFRWFPFGCRRDGRSQPRFTLAPSSASSGHFFLSDQRPQLERRGHSRPFDSGRGSVGDSNAGLFSAGRGRRRVCRQSFRPECPHRSLRGCRRNGREVLMFALVDANSFYRCGPATGRSVCPDSGRGRAGCRRRIRVLLRALPSCHLTLSCVRPRNYVYAIAEDAYPMAPRTIGERIRKRRMDLAIEQKELARRLGVTPTAVWKWEHNKSMPGFRAKMGVDAFLR